MKAKKPQIMNDVYKSDRNLNTELLYASASQSKATFLTWTTWFNSVEMGGFTVIQPCRNEQCFFFLQNKTLAVLERGETAVYRVYFATIEDQFCPVTNKNSFICCDFKL